MAGYVVVYRHYLSLGGRDVEDMLRAAGTDPRPYRDAMRAALFEGKAPGSVAPGLLKSVGARRLLFPKGGARIAADDVDCIAQGLAAVRLCSWYKLLSDIPESMDAECAALDAAGYLELCESLYRDVYAKPARMANPYAMKQLDGLFRHVSSRLDDDISVLLRDSHGPAAGAMAFAAQDAAFALTGRTPPRGLLRGVRRRHPQGRCVVPGRSRRRRGDGQGVAVVRRPGVIGDRTGRSVIPWTVGTSWRQSSGLSWCSPRYVRSEVSSYMSCILFHCIVDCPHVGMLIRGWHGRPSCVNTPWQTAPSTGWMWYAWVGHRFRDGCSGSTGPSAGR